MNRPSMNCDSFVCFSPCLIPLLNSTSIVFPWTNPKIVVVNSSQHQLCFLGINLGDVKVLSVDGLFGGVSMAHNITIYFYGLFCNMKHLTPMLFLFHPA